MESNKTGLVRKDRPIDRHAVNRIYPIENEDFFIVLAGRFERHAHG